MLSGIAAGAQGLDTINIPFYDDFASAKNGAVSMRLWQRSSVYANAAYAAPHHSMLAATFDILDNDGKVYAAAANAVFAADTLASHAFNIKHGSPNTYISFSFLAGGYGDMPEAEDSLLLYFFQPSASRWYLAWTGATNANMAHPCDTIAEHYVLRDSTDDAYNRVHVVKKTAYQANTFLTAKVEVPPEFCDTGFRFMFINLASRAPSEIAGMLSNCDMWHLDYVYLDSMRSADNTTIRDVAVLQPPAIRMQEYTSIPWRHMANNRTLWRNLLLNGDAIDFQFKIWASQPTPINIDLLVQMLYSGGAYDLPFPNIVGQNIPADTSAFAQHIPNAYSILETPPDDADSAALKVQITLYNYYAEPRIASRLTDNDTAVFMLNFYDYYAYDDGTAENGYGIYGENATGSEFAVKFHAYRADTLTGLYIYFNHALGADNQAFTIVVRRNNGGIPGDVIYSMRDWTDFRGLNEFIAYHFDRKILLPAGDFFVGIRMQSGAMLNIGVDMNNVRAGKTFVRTELSWQASQVDGIGSLMLRPSFARSSSTLQTHAAPSMQHIALSIYPNPAHDVVNIALPDDIAANALNISIIDAMGRIMRQQAFAPTIDVAGLSEGIYLLSVENSAGSIVAAGKIAVAK